MRAGHDSQVIVRAGKGSVRANSGAERPGGAEWAVRAHAVLPVTVRNRRCKVSGVKDHGVLGQLSGCGQRRKSRRRWQRLPGGRGSQAPAHGGHVAGRVLRRCHGAVRHVRAAATNGAAAETRGCSWRRSHGTAGDGLSKGCIGLGDNEASCLLVEDSAIEVFRGVVLEVVSVLVSTGRLRLRVVKVFLVERSNAVGAVLRVLFGVVVHRRHGTQAHRQTVRVLARLVNVQSGVGGLGAEGCGCDRRWDLLDRGLGLTRRWRCDLESIAIAGRAEDAVGGTVGDDSLLGLDARREACGLLDRRLVDGLALRVGIGNHDLGDVGRRLEGGILLLDL